MRMQGRAQLRGRGSSRRQGSAPHTLVLQRREGSSRSVPYSGPQGEGVVTPLQTGIKVGLPCEQATWLKEQSNPTTGNTTGACYACMAALNPPRGQGRRLSIVRQENGLPLPPPAVRQLIPAHVLLHVLLLQPAGQTCKLAEEERGKNGKAGEQAWFGMRSGARPPQAAAHLQATQNT
jgi:hypothetical protein